LQNKTTFSKVEAHQLEIQVICQECSLFAILAAELKFNLIWSSSQQGKKLPGKNRRIGESLNGFPAGQKLPECNAT